LKPIPPNPGFCLPNRVWVTGWHRSRSLCDNQSVAGARRVLLPM
jgi:hypothetical protein